MVSTECPTKIYSRMCNDLTELNTCSGKDLKFTVLNRDNSEIIYSSNF